MGRTKYRIEHRYPCYPGGSCMPYDGYFVQRLEEGFFFDKWIDIKGFTSKKEAQELKRILEK